MKLRVRRSLGDVKGTLKRRISSFLLVSVVVAVGSLDIASFLVESNYLNNTDKTRLISSSFIVTRTLLAEYESNTLSATTNVSKPALVSSNSNASPIPRSRGTLFSSGATPRGSRIPSGTCAFLYSMSGRYLGSLTFGLSEPSSRLPPLNEISSKILKSYLERGFFVIGSNDHSLPYLGLARSLTQSRGYVIIALPVADARSTLTTLAITELAATLLIVGVLLLAASVVVGREVLPLERLSAVAEEVSRGNLGVRVDIESNSREVESLVKSFNSMVSALEGQFRAREEASISLREFMASASHELGTPLTAILGFSEILLERDLGDKEEVSIVNRIHEEALRLNLLVSDLLNISKFDKPKPLDFEVIELGEFLYDVVESYRLREPTVTLLSDIQIGVYIRGDRLRLREVLDNFFTNALRHSGLATGLVIEVTLLKEGAEAFVIFHDNGVGISDALAPQIFKPFIRGDKSRGGSKVGSGLGLSIAERIIISHGGRITCEPDDGATFVLRLPIISWP